MVRGAASMPRVGYSLTARRSQGSSAPYLSPHRQDRNEERYNERKQQYDHEQSQALHSSSSITGTRRTLGEAIKKSEGIHIIFRPAPRGRLARVTSTV